MSTALKLMTVEEFLPWAEGKEERWELHDGVPVMISSAEPVMMSPERAVHIRTKFRVAKALDGAVTTAGLPCELFADGMAIRVDARTAYEPDGSVACGPPVPADAVEIDNPVIVVEVLSPIAAAIDQGRKLSGYFSIPSVEHSLILDPDRRVVIHHKRGASDAIETRVLTGGAARLDPPGLEVAVEALFPRNDRLSSAAPRPQNLNRAQPGAALPNWSVILSRPRMPIKVPSTGVG
jgi:Uma2 family endonuclease